MEATDGLPDFAETQVKEIDLTIVNTLNLTMVKSPELTVVNLWSPDYSPRVYNVLIMNDLPAIRGILYWHATKAPVSLDINSS